MTIAAVVPVTVMAAALFLAPTAIAEPSQFDDTGGTVNVNGVPCFAHLGTCLSFIQNRPPNASSYPQTRVGHSPTIRR